MNVNERREEILSLLKESKSPTPAKALAERYQVSRQVIVQDMAVIRAAVPGISSTNRGYLFQKENSCSREFKVRHGEDQTKEELYLIVDCGGHVKNISVSHRVYGRISVEMDIRSRQDVEDFIQAFENSKSTLLGSTTSGYHYHLVKAPSEERLDLIAQRLTDAGILAPPSPWEQENMDKQKEN